MTTEELAAKVSKIQADMYDYYGIDCLPAADSNCANHASLLKEMDEWMADQLRKASWFELVDKRVIDYVDEIFNAHEVAYVCGKMLKGEM